MNKLEKVSYLLKKVTSKGLIYVAKMNENGDLELI